MGLLDVCISERFEAVTSELQEFILSSVGTHVLHIVFDLTLSWIKKACLLCLEEYPGL